MDDAFYDSDSGLIILRSAGFHSPEQVCKRGQIVADLVAEVKRNRGYVRILNFALDLPVQSSEVAASSTHEAANKNALDGPRDRFAIVISSALARMQMQRIIGSHNRRVFSNEVDARFWLAET